MIELIVFSRGPLWISASYPVLEQFGSPESGTRVTTWRYLYEN